MSNKYGKNKFEDVLRSLDKNELPVFQQRWWLDIALKARPYREARVIEDGVEKGYLPYITGRNKLGLAWGLPPYWSHLSGPLADASLSAEQKKQVLTRLIAQLPKHTRFSFSCLPDAVTGPLIRDAFLQAGFSHSIQNTYSYPADDPGIMSRLNKKQRKHLRAAERQLDIVEMDGAAFTTFYAANLNMAGRKSYAPLAVAKALIDAGCRRAPPQVRVLAARRKNAPEDGKTVWDAAIACAWDSKRYYFWMLTRRLASQPEAALKPHPDAVKLLIIKAAEHAKELGLIFDLDGAASPGADYLYRDILKAPVIEYRDVYKRTRLAHQAADRLRGFRFRGRAFMDAGAKDRKTLYARFFL